MQTAVHTRRGVERILRFAFELARTRRRRLTMITKSNAQRYAYVLWDRVLAELVPAFPDVETDKLHIDAATLELVRRPHTFDVIVGSNLFGDILSDLTGGVTGSLGLNPSANLNPERTVAVVVRARARLCAGHRRQGHRQPDGRHPERRDDARVAGRGGGRGVDSPRGRGRARRGSCNARHRGHGDDDAARGGNHGPPRALNW